MPSFSVLTNSQAASAVLNLVKTLNEQNSVQTRMNTGLRVATAKDDASGWAIATTMRSDIAGFQAVKESLNFTNSTVAAGRSSAEKVSELINDIQTKITDAQLQGADVTKIQADIDGLVETIKTTVNSASINGVNVIDNSGVQKVLASVDRSASGLSAAYINVEKSDLRVEGGDLASLTNINLEDRGGQLMTNATDGVRTVEFVPGGAPAAGSIVVNYTDADGNAQSIDVDVGATTATAITDLNNDKAFSELFVAQAGTAANSIEFMAKDRITDSQVQITTIGGSAETWTQAESTVTLNFNATAPLKVGESLVMDYDINGAATITMVVTEGQNSGDILGTDANGNLTVALNADDVADTNNATVGTAIATAVHDALVAQTDFVTGATNAVAGTSLEVVQAGGQVIIETADGTDGISSFQLPLNDFSAILQEVDAARDTAIDAAASLGSAQMQLENQDEFLGELLNALNDGLGTLVDANMAEEAARFQALQVQQQLGVQALSIANQQPQIILSLFG